MKHWTIRILLMLTLGAVTTVGVAWGFAYFTQYRPTYESYLTHQGGRQWKVEVTRQFGHTSVSRVPNNGRWSNPDFGTEPGIVPYWSTANRRPTQELYDDATMPWHIEFASGWPLRSGYVEVRSRVYTKTGQHIRRNVWRATSGLTIVEDDPNASVIYYKVVPLRPILPGFSINTLFYAAIWFALFFGFGALKRAIRRKRRRCPRCGYDLRGNVTNGQDARSTNDDARSTGCPECGWNRSESGN